MGGEEVAIDAAIRVSQPRELGVGAEKARQALITRLQVVSHGRGHQDPLAHQAVQRLLLQLRRIQQLGIDARHLLAHAFNGPLMGLVPFAACDGSAIHLRHGSGALLAEARVTLHPKENKRGKNQQHQHELEHFLVGAYEVKHMPRNNEGEPEFASWTGCGGC